MNHIIVLCGLILCATSCVAQFTYREFSSIKEMTLNGDAERLSDRIRVVRAAPSRGGSVWFNKKQRVTDGFEATFEFQVSEPGSYEAFLPGADGIAFVLQNSSLFEGGIGGGMGYQDIHNSLAVEFDTYDNNPDENPEPNGNHISVQTRGREPNSAMMSASMGITTNIPDLKHGDRHTARVRYLPGHLEIYLDDMSRPVLSVAVRLDTLLQLDNGSCWMGFTAATGGSWANFDLFTIQNNIVLAIDNIYFDTDKSVLKPTSFPALKKLVAILQDAPNLKAEIGGHTDIHGGDEHNLHLSTSRAEAVRDYLIRSGISSNRLSARGYGSTISIATNETEQGRAQNRRVEARLSAE